MREREIEIERGWGVGVTEITCARSRNLVVIYQTSNKLLRL